MEPGNSKHSPRLDDELAHEQRSIVQGAPVEAHAREDLIVEEALNHADTRPGGSGTPAGMSQEDIDLRAALDAALRPARFPCDRAELLRVAEHERGGEDVLALINRLPSGRSWENLHAVWAASSGPSEQRY